VTLFREVDKEKGKEENVKKVSEDGKAVARLVATSFVTI
jgi:hypothetical protein